MVILKIRVYIVVNMNIMNIDNIDNVDSTIDRYCNNIGYFSIWNILILMMIVRIDMESELFIYFCVNDKIIKNE